MGEGNSLKTLGEMPGRVGQMPPFNPLCGDLWTVYLWLLPLSGSRLEWEVGGLGGGRCCKGWVWAVAARLPGFCVCRKCKFAGRNGMFPLALQEQKQLWDSLKRQLLSEKLICIL